MRYDNTKTEKENFARLLNSEALYPNILPSDFVLGTPVPVTPGVGNGNSNTSMVISSADGSGNPINPTTTVYYNRRYLTDMRSGMPPVIYVDNDTTIVDVREEILARFNLPADGVVIFDPLEGMPLPGDETVFYVTPALGSNVFLRLSTIGIRVINTQLPSQLDLGLTPTQLFGAPSFQRNGRNVWVLNSRLIPTLDYSTTPRYIRSGNGPRYMRILADEKANRGDFKFRNRPNAITFGIPTAGTQGGYTGNTFIDFEIGDGSVLTGNGTFLYTRFDLPGTSNSSDIVNAPPHLQQLPVDTVISRAALLDYLGLPGDDNFTWTFTTARRYSITAASDCHSMFGGSLAVINPLPAA